MTRDEELIEAIRTVLAALEDDGPSGLAKGVGMAAARDIATYDPAGVYSRSRRFLSRLLKRLEPKADAP